MQYNYYRWAGHSLQRMQENEDDNIKYGQCLHKGDHVCNSIKQKCSGFQKSLGVKTGTERKFGGFFVDINLSFNFVTLDLMTEQMTLVCILVTSSESTYVGKYFSIYR